MGDANDPQSVVADRTGLASEDGDNPVASTVEDTPAAVTDKKWRIATVDNDFADGKPKDGIEFYLKNASGDGPEGDKPEDVNTITEADVGKYVVEDTSAAQPVVEPVVEPVVADGSGSTDEVQSKDQNTDEAVDEGVVDEDTANLIYTELRQIIHQNLITEEASRPSMATINAGIKMFERDPDKNQKLVKAENKGGGRRRTKRKGRKGAKKSSQSNQSKKGGRSRKSGSKNHRKQSRRRKH